MAGAAGSVAAGSGGSGATAGTGSGADAGTGTGAASGSGGATAMGPGLSVGGKCFAACAFPETSDPDPETGAVNGYGWEGQAACVDPASAVGMMATPCEPPPPVVPPTPGDGGVYTGDACHPFCSSTATDPDDMGLSDGWGYEHGQSCIVAGTAAAIGGVACDPMLPPLGTGDGVLVNDGMGGTVCHPLCRDVVASMPDANGWGWENDTNCILAGSIAQLQGVPCDAPDPPEPPPPAPPPPGTGWSSDYTATMFGEVDCAPFGFDDPGNSNLNFATCVGRGQVSLNSDNQKWFGAVGDLSTLWSGSACTCTGGSSGDKCSTAPACNGQANCGTCVEVVCNGTGTYSYEGDGYTHDEFCKPNTSVVVQLIDACPHNHPNNPYWCTTQRPNHVNISCSAFNELVQGDRPIGEIGFINAYARPVNCSVGLGVHGF